jgi:hypothetical protein
MPAGAAVGDDSVNSVTRPVPSPAVGTGVATSAKAGSAVGTAFSVDVGGGSLVDGAGAAASLVEGGGPELPHAADSKPVQAMAHTAATTF